MLLKKVSHVALLLVLMLSCGTLYASAAPILSLDPSSLVVQPGQNFSLDVRNAGVTDLYAFQFDLAFDPFILSATSVTEGPFLLGCGPGCFSEGTIDTIAGTIASIADTLAGPVVGVNGSGTVATVTFHALALGTSPITLSNVILLDSHLGDIPASTADGAVTVQAATGVPEPTTWLLLATGCVGLLGYGWRRQRAA